VKITDPVRIASAHGMMGMRISHDRRVRWAAWTLIAAAAVSLTALLSPTAGQAPAPSPPPPPAKDKQEPGDEAEKSGEPAPTPSQPPQEEAARPKPPPQTPPAPTSPAPSRPQKDPLESAAEKLQTEGTPPAAPKPADAKPPATTPTPPAAGDPSARLGLWVLTPALVAIGLSIFTRQVVPSLVVGVFVGAYMMLPFVAPGDPLTKGNSVIAGFRLAMERYVLGAVIDPKYDFAHAKIIVFTLSIGFLIGVIGRNGGTEGMVEIVTGRSRSRKRGALTASTAGLVVFFDDYANCMIIGPTMQPVFDRLRLSRAKLAYIVDSTAAPVASLALIGTWVGTEIGYIDQGLRSFGEGHLPAFLGQPNGGMLSGMTVFLQSIPYRFYAIFAIILVLLISLTERDFGPMLRSERLAMSGPDRDPAPPPTTEAAPEPKRRPRWWLGFVPVAVLVLVTLVVLIVDGWRAEKTIALMNTTGPGGWASLRWWEKASTVIGNSDSYLPIFYGAVLAVLSAVITTLAARACTIRETFDAGMEGMGRVFPALVILVLAWAISAVMQDLKLGEAVSNFLRAQSFQPMWLPLAIFLAACVISFATGTSWGTMGILCPMTVEIAARLVADLPAPQALTLFYASVGSVLAGAVFGDHCSPISDTTVLSSLSTGCRHEEHVWTQIPYAVLAAIAEIAFGDILCSVYHWPWHYGLGLGTVFMVLVLFIIGRKPTPRFQVPRN
jgi:Na+/H+ antiporter NhaC